MQSGGGGAKAPQQVDGGGLMVVQGAKPLKKVLLFSIWRANKQLKIEET